MLNLYEIAKWDTCVNPSFDMSSIYLPQKCRHLNGNSTAIGALQRPGTGCKPPRPPSCGERGGLAQQPPPATPRTQQDAASSAPKAYDIQ